MVTYWESSRRPLFVKTVWRDGQHHVVLQKEDHSEALRTTASASSARSVRSAGKTASSNLKAVKLLLAGVGNFNCAEKKLMRCTSSVKAQERDKPWSVLPQRPVTSRNANKELFNAATSKNLNLSIKSSSIDLNGGCNKVGGVTPYFSYSNYTDQYNSLSERVMIWLDLATQNDNYNGGNAIECKRIVTACHIAQKRQQAAVKHKSLPNYQLNVDTSKAMHVAGTSQSVQLTNSSVLRRCPSGAGVHADDLIVIEQCSESDEHPRLSSEVEKDLLMEQVEQRSSKNKISTTKRQLHIFMPNLPKKFSDCDSSILSSKISSCSLPRSVNFRKL